MLKRTWTSLLIAGVWLIFFLLKKFVQVDFLGKPLGDLLFDLLLLFMAACGANEMLRVFGSKIDKPHRVLTVAYPIALYPAMSLLGVPGSLVVTMLAILAVLAVTVPCYKTVTVESIALTFLSMVYPSGLLVCLIAVNHFAPFSALVLAFAISPLADVMAYLIGSWLKGPKLCPNVSPNKTVSGAIGGLIGGVLGAVLVSLVPFVHPESEFLFDNRVQEVVVFAIIGLLGAILTEYGDLVESLIKRKLGIKDMGKLLPGHGGVMDRIDGILFASPLIAFIFCVVIPNIVA